MAGLSSASAPTTPQPGHSMRGPKDGTGAASGQRSTAIFGCVPNLSSLPCDPPMAPDGGAAWASGSGDQTSKTSNPITVSPTTSIDQSPRSKPKSRRSFVACTVTASPRCFFSFGRGYKRCPTASRELVAEPRGEVQKAGAGTEAAAETGRCQGDQCATDGGPGGTATEITTPSRSCAVG
jgi:hypothetical protein